MEIKEIDGKKFIEYNEHRAQRRRLIIAILFLIVIAGAIIALINTTKTLLENKDIIQKDPLRFGMDVHGFVSCQCQDAEGQEWYSLDTGFINTRRSDNWINYSEIRTNADKLNQVFNGSG